MTLPIFFAKACAQELMIFSSEVQGFRLLSHGQSTRSGSFSLFFKDLSYDWFQFFLFHWWCDFLFLTRYIAFWFLKSFGRALSLIIHLLFLALRTIAPCCTASRADLHKLERCGPELHNHYAFYFSFIYLPNLLKIVFEFHDKISEGKDCSHFPAIRAPDHDACLFFLLINKISSFEEEMAKLILEILCFDGDEF